VLEVWIPAMQSRQSLLAALLGMRERLRDAVASILLRKLRRIPVHVAIIPDGNRRWARRHGLKPWEGHVAGYIRVRRVLNFLWDLGVRTVTLYALSYENCLRRPLSERRFLYALLSKAVSDILRDPRVVKGLVRVRPAGELSLLPPPLRRRVRFLAEKTATNKPYTLNIGLCYSGEWEILDLVAKISRTELRKRFSISTEDQIIYYRDKQFALIFKMKEYLYLCSHIHKSNIFNLLIKGIFFPPKEYMHMISIICLHYRPHYQFFFGETCTN